MFGRGIRQAGRQACVGEQSANARHLEMGTFMHACEGEMVCESVNPKIPYFNAPIYLENKVSRQPLEADDLLWLMVACGGRLQSER